MMIASNDALVLVGEAADLAVLRAASLTGDRATLDTALEQFLLHYQDHDDDDGGEVDLRLEETILLGPLIEVIMSGPAMGNDDEGNDDDGNFSETIGETTTIADGHIIDRVKGTLVVSKHSVFFWAEDAADSARDLLVAPRAIVLHALQEEENSDVIANASNDETAVSVYLQLEVDPDEAPYEVHFYAKRDNRIGESADSEEIFNALSKLVSLHPISLEGEDDGGATAAAGLMGMMAMLGGSGDNILGGFMTNDRVSQDIHDNEETDDDDNDDLVWAPSNSIPPFTTDTVVEQPDATSLSERDAMLERLDRLLVVPPDLEQADGEEERGGQFDDAENDDEDNGFL